MPTLFKHQEDGAAYLTRNPRAGYWGEAGIGKTVIALEALKRANLYPALVVTKKSIVWDAWVGDLDKFQPETTYAVAAGNAKEREKALSRNVQITIANYEAVVQRSYYDFLRKPWKCVILDESTAIKAHSTKTSQRIRDLCHKGTIEAVWALSGCPTPNHLLDFWAQFDAIRPGLLEYSYFSHRASRFYQPNPRNAAWLWVPKHGAKDQLLDDIAPHCKWQRVRDCIDLPETVDVVEHVTLDRAEQTVYDQMVRSWVARFDDHEIVGATALAELMKLRQITAGIVNVGQGGKADWRPLGKTKLKWVLDKLNSECRNVEGVATKAVVVGYFRSEVERYVEEIGKDKSLKRTAAAFYGGLSDKRRRWLINEFQGGALDTLVVHPAAMAHGITLTAANTMIFASLDYSHENYLQVRKRIDRIGQTEICRYLHCLAHRTIDGKIYEVLTGKGGLTKDLVADFRERIGKQYPALKTV